MNEMDSNRKWEWRYVAWLVYGSGWYDNRDETHGYDSEQPGEYEYDGLQG